MENQKWLKLLLIITFVIFTLQLFAQNKAYTPPQKMTQTGGFEGGLYPIGWSKDDAYFARLMFNTETGEEKPPEGYYFTLVITEMKTRRDAYVKRIDGSTFCTTSKCIFTIDSIWNAYYESFSNKLNQYGIVQMEKFDWVTFPSSQNEQTFGTKVDQKKGMVQEILNEKVYLKSSQQGTKLIHDQTFQGAESIPIETEISGAIVSPNKKNFIVVKNNKFKGMKGKMNSKAVFIPCSLTSGFR